MPLDISAVQSLRRVFNQSFSAHDIAEPLVSFDTTSSAAEVRALATEKLFEVVGLRDEGLIVGFVKRDELADGVCADHLHAIDDSQVVPDTAPLVTVVLGLRDAPRLFVSLLGRVGGIITRSDLQKPPVRMWLFGMVTLIEMRFSHLITQLCPNDSWKSFLSEGRVSKAQELLAERTRRNQDLDLLDCIQFSDKGQIVARSEELRATTRFESRRQIEQVFKGLERLRNNLAHSQDIITSDWDMIVMLAENLESILLGPPGLREDEK